MSPLPLRERVRVRGWWNEVQRWIARHQRALWPRGASHFCQSRQKQPKALAPAARLFPPVLALRGTRQRRTFASLSLRRVCADDASTTAQHCALWGGQRGGSGAKQLCSVRRLLPQLQASDSLFFLSSKRYCQEGDTSHPRWIWHFPIFFVQLLPRKQHFQT